MKRILFLILSLFSLIRGEAIERRQALERLQEGNKQFILKQPRSTLENNVASQTPFAVILSCADSRVPPEILFNQSIGDLFVVRVAGNVAVPAIRDSIVYAADALQAPLIVVLGHQNCGAVKAVLTTNSRTSDLESIVPYIRSGVNLCMQQPGDPLVNAIKANVLEQVRFLKLNPILSHLIQEEKLSIVGAYYHLETGEVEFLTRDKE